MRLGPRKCHARAPHSGSNELDGKALLDAPDERQLIPLLI
jgi:hypothetical protein